MHIKIGLIHTLLYTTMCVINKIDVFTVDTVDGHKIKCVPFLFKLHNF